MEVKYNVALVIFRKCIIVVEKKIDAHVLKTIAYKRHVCD